MCLAVLVGPDGTMTKDQFKNAWEKNSHGGGVVFIRDDKFWFVKSLSSYEEIWNGFEEGIKTRDKGTSIMVHFRLATHGSKTIKNTHPFFLNNFSMAMIHNGVLSIETDKDRTDSEQFGIEFLGPMEKAGVLDNDILIKSVERYIGGSKIAILRIGKKPIILNERCGHWVDDVWFSNNSYKETTRVVVASREAWRWSKEKKEQKDIGEIVNSTAKGYAVYIGKGKTKWYKASSFDYKPGRCFVCGHDTFNKNKALCFDCKGEFMPKCKNDVCHKRLWQNDIDSGETLCFTCRGDREIRTRNVRGHQSYFPVNKESLDDKCVTCGVVLDEVDFMCSPGKYLCKDCVEDKASDSLLGSKENNPVCIEEGCGNIVVKVPGSMFHLTDRCWSCEQTKRANENIIAL